MTMKRMDQCKHCGHETFNISGSVARCVYCKNDFVIQRPPLASVPVERVERVERRMVTMTCLLCGESVRSETDVEVKWLMTVHYLGFHCS